VRFFFYREGPGSNFDRDRGHPDIRHDFLRPSRHIPVYCLEMDNDGFPQFFSSLFTTVHSLNTIRSDLPTCRHINNTNKCKIWISHNGASEDACLQALVQLSLSLLRYLSDLTGAVICFVERGESNIIRNVGEFQVDYAASRLRNNFLNKR